MSLSDRMIYQGSYAPIIQSEIKPDDDSKTKKKKKKGYLTIFQKNAILRSAFVSENKYMSTIDLVQKKAKAPSPELKNVAKDVEMIFKRSSMPSRNTAKIIESIAKLDEKRIVELANLAIPSEPKIPKPNKKEKESNGIALYPLMAVMAALPPIGEVDPTIYQSFLGPAFGFMHLERLRFTPIGTERGELLYSLPLAPGEEVVLAHKTWAKTTKEFTELVLNVIEKEITTQRTESLELSESTQNQSQYAADMSTSAQGGGNIGVVKISGTASTSLSASTSATTEESVKRNIQTTEKATARSKQEHKTTFQVSSEVGYEDESHRRIKNPNRTHAVRYDYFRYMRKWQIDLERYGVRLTMDVMVSDPGGNLRKAHDERRRLEELVNGSFECPYTVDDIDESDLPVGVSAKPQPYPIVKTDRKNEPFWGIGMSENFPYEFTIPDGYEAASASVRIVAKESGTPNVYKVTPDSSITGARGSITIWVHVGLSETENWVEYSITLDVRPMAETITNWENSVIQTMCLEAQQQWQAEKADAQTRLEQIVIKEREAPTLILRKEEREEIMAGVMKLFLPPTMSPESAPDSVAKFMHEAFEWENMSYFLYPYFWQDIETALEIEHADSLRRDFLRAGWARVLVPVRPLYEEKVLAYSLTGDPDELIPSSTMRSVAQQIMDAHKTSYAYEKSPEGITSEKFEVMAMWYEYTPTDAIDLTAHLLDGDIAEPRLAEQLSDEHDQRMAENDILDADKTIREKIADSIENLPAGAKIKGLKSGSGDEVELA